HVLGSHVAVELSFPPTKVTAAGFRNIKYSRISRPTPMPSLSSPASWKMKAGNATILCRNPSSHPQRNRSGRDSLSREKDGGQEINLRDLRNPRFEYFS